MLKIRCLISEKKFNIIKLSLKNKCKKKIKKIIPQLIKINLFSKRKESILQDY
jgi:hypothetical protein